MFEAAEVGRTIAKEVWDAEVPKLRAELLAVEAARRGYEKQAPVRYTAKDSAAQALVRAEVEDKITPQAIASNGGRPKPSYSEGNTNTLADEYTAARSASRMKPRS